MSQKHCNTLSFIGMSSIDVTNSAYYIDTGKTKLLLDYGLYQSSDILEAYKSNHRHIKLKLKNLNCVIISHCNADHISGIPLLFKKGGSPNIYVPRGTKQLIELMLRDSAKIFESDVIRLKKSCGLKNASPLYNNNDIDMCLPYIIECSVGEDIQVSEDVKFKYFEAGHIIKSCQIYLEIQNGNLKKRVGYTGDIGSDIEKNYNKKYESLPYVDILIGETTYSSEKRQHSQKDRVKDIEKIQTLVREVCCESHGKILAGIFSLDRLQNVLTTFYQIFKDDPSCPVIVIDAPLGAKISKFFDNLIDLNHDLWRDVVNWDKIRWATDWETSLQYQNSVTPMIILSSSGMMVSGRILSHLKKILPNSNNVILFCGYAGEDTLASQIKDRRRKLEVIASWFITNVELSTNSLLAA